MFFSIARLDNHRVHPQVFLGRLQKRMSDTSGPSGPRARLGNSWWSMEAQLFATSIAIATLRMMQGGGVCFFSLETQVKISHQARFKDDYVCE